MPAVSRHYCDYPDCDKNFQRLEHLRRHKLNHTNRTILCPQCGKIFYRNDLLQRHLTLKHGRNKRRQLNSTCSAATENAERDSQIPHGISIFQVQNCASRPDISVDQSPREHPCGPQLTEFIPASTTSHISPNTIMINNGIPASQSTPNNFGYNLDWWHEIVSDVPPDGELRGTGLRSRESHESFSPLDLVFEPTIFCEVSISDQTHRDIMDLIAVRKLTPHIAQFVLFILYRFSGV